MRLESSLALAVIAFAVLGGLLVTKLDAEPEKVKLEVREIHHYHYVTKPEPMELTATAYSPEKSQTDDTPYQTAIMTRPKKGWTVAVSRDLMGYLGRRVYVKGMGVFRVEDLMAKRFKKSIDFFFDSKREAVKFGKRKVEAVFLD